MLRKWLWLVQVVGRVDAAEAAGKITPWAEELPPDRLMQEAPTAGTVTGERDLENLSARELTLGNGMRVVYRQSDLQDDQILLMVRSSCSTHGCPWSHVRARLT